MSSIQVSFNAVDGDGDPLDFLFFEQGIPRMSLGDVCDFQQKKIAKELKWTLIEPRYSSRGWLGVSKPQMICSLPACYQ